VQGVIADVFEPAIRGAASGLFMIPLLVGPLLGPLLGGVLSQVRATSVTTLPASLCYALVTKQLGAIKGAARKCPDSAAGGAPAWSLTRWSAITGRSDKFMLPLPSLSDL
jgi:MFS family permease